MSNKSALISSHGITPLADQIFFKFWNKTFDSFIWDGWWVWEIAYQTKQEEEGVIDRGAVTVVGERGLVLSAKMGRVTGLTMIWDSWARAQCYLLFPAVTLYATMAPLPTNRSEYCCCPQLANWVKKYQSGGIQNWRYIKDKLGNPPSIYLLLLYAALCFGNIFFELRHWRLKNLFRI